MNRPLVLDVSCSAEFIMGKEGADSLEEYLTDASSIIAPSLYKYEATNLFWKYHNFHDIPIGQCQSSLRMALDLPDTYVESDDLYPETFKLSCVSEHVSYDVFYLVLAQRKNAILATMDEELRTLAKDQGADVHERP